MDHASKMARVWRAVEDSEFNLHAQFDGAIDRQLEEGGGRLSVAGEEGIEPVARHFFGQNGQEQDGLVQDLVGFEEGKASTIRPPVTPNTAHPAQSSDGCQAKRTAPRLGPPAKAAAQVKL